MANALLRLYESIVPAAWVDYNRHMNDASYAIAFSHTTDRLMDHIGLDASYREREQLTIYTLENHICYLLEANEGDAVYATTQLLGHDSKRLRVFHTLHRAGEEQPLATSEQMLLHVDRTGPKAAPFAAEVAARVAAVARQQAGLALPQQAGQAIRTL